MRIGVPREIKDQEYRVGLTPAGVQALGYAYRPTEELLATNMALAS